MSSLTKKIAFLMAIPIIAFSLTKTEKEKLKQDYNQFIKKYETEVIPLFKQTNEAYFNSTISGKTEDYNKSAELQIKLSKIYVNKNDFELVKKVKESGIFKNDPIEKRRIDILYLQFLGNQVDEKLLEESIKLGTEIENKFSTFRANVDGKQLTDNQIEDILKTSKNSDEVKKAWLAHKEVGNVVSADVIKVVKVRNKIAQSLGFKNYHQMSLTLSEQNPKEIEKLFNDLDNLTRKEFAKMKNLVDENLAAKFGIKKEELRPWHYQNRFFQEAPAIFDVDLDKYYKDKDVAELAKKYYASIGLDVTDILQKSDLYEKEGKYQHAYCTDIDRKGDVRVVCNIKPSFEWMGTTMHELGHANYMKYADRNLPFDVVREAHIFTTEAIAMMFGRLPENPQWIQDMTGISNEEKTKIANDCKNSLKLRQLTFSRWAQVMFRFEKALYDNPDQDLNKVWWDLVEKYQMLKRPEGRNNPDWASKIHIATVPCYYHNYLMGELLASQLNSYIVRTILRKKDINSESYYNSKETGKFLIDKIFMPQAKFEWNTMIEKATGEKLTPKYYAEQFVK